jgi:hypothetical protein
LALGIEALPVAKMATADTLLYEGQGGKGIRTRAAAEGPGPPRGAAAGRTSSATPSTYLIPRICGPRHRSPPLPGVFTKCSCHSAGVQRHYGISSVRLVGGPRPPLSAPTNRRAGPSALGPSWFGSPGSVPVTAPEVRPVPPGSWPGQRKVLSRVTPTTEAARCSGHDGGMMVECPSRR